MWQEVMSNFSTVNVIVLLSSIFIGFFCLKKALDGDFVRYRWVVALLACAFTYDIIIDGWSQLHVVPFAILLWANFAVSYLILLGKMEAKTDDNDELKEILKMREANQRRKSSIFSHRDDSENKNTRK